MLCVCVLCVSVCVVFVLWLEKRGEEEKRDEEESFFLFFSCTRENVFCNYN